MGDYCHNDWYPCECGGWREKYRTICQQCRDKKDREKWQAKPQEEWDGDYPIALQDPDEEGYLFDEYAVMEHIFNLDMDDRKDGWAAKVWERLEEIEFEMCEEDDRREFCLADEMNGKIPENWDIYDYDGAKEAEKAVNDFIQSTPPSFISNGKKITESVKEYFRALVEEEIQDLIKGGNWVK